MNNRRMRMRWRVGVIVAAVVASGGCKKQPATNGDPASQTDGAAKPVPALFAHVPADTPYLIAGLEAIPLDYYARMKNTFAPIFEGMIAKARQDSKQLDAILGELDGKWNQAGLESLGLSAQPRYAFYGLGLQPFVARIEVKDHKVLLATIERFATKLGKQLPAMQTTADGRGYWRVATGDGPVLVLALTDNQLIAALGSAAEIDGKLGLILGSEKPPTNMADGKLVRSLMAKHKLGPHVVGFVETHRIASAALTAAGAASAPACTAEIARISAKVPRLVFGTGELSPTRITQTMIVELSPEVATAVRAVKVEVPGLAAALAGPALFAFGGGLDLARGQQLAIAAAGDLKQLGAACEIAPLASGAEKAAAALARPLPEPFGRIAGGAIVAHELDIDRAAANPMPKKLEAVAVLAAPNAKALFETLVKQVPQLAQLGVAPDGKLHDLPTGAVPAPWPVAAAVADNRVVIAFGERRTKLGEQMLAAPTAPAPLLAMSYDYGKLLELALAVQPPDLENADPLAAGAMTSFIRAMRSVFGRATLTIDVTDAGVATWGSLELK
jgi:hypothetical protein